jgi:hypothetical protein
MSATAKKETGRICPKCHGWTTDPCRFCSYAFVGCTYCESWTEGTCHWCKRKVEATK